MKEWDPKALSESFRIQYEDSARYCREIKSGKVTRTDSYKTLHDEYWASCFVFDHVLCSSCLASREQLLLTLNEMLENTPTPFGAYDGKLFEAQRVKIITGLISKFTCDGIGAD